MRNFTHLDDHQCAALAQGGEGRAFAVLVTRYQDRIYRFLLRLTRSREDALDLTQDTFLRAHQALERWRPEAGFRSWLFRIARNAAFDRMRRDKLLEFVAMDDALEHDAAVADPAPGPEQVLDTAQRLQQLDAALQALPAAQREILLLREIEQLSYDEIALVLGLNPGTVKSRLARARSALLERVQCLTEPTP